MEAPLKIRKTASLEKQPPQPRVEDAETENTLEYNVNHYSNLRGSIRDDSLFNTQESPFHDEISRDIPEVREIKTQKQGVARAI